MLQFVENIDEIIENIKTLEHYLTSEVKEEKQFAEDLVKKGRSMIVYKVDGHNHFAPSKFVGLKKNSMSAYIDNEKRESRDTAPAIKSLIGKPFTHLAIDQEFQEYASSFKGNTLKSKRKYWRVRNDENKYLDLGTTADTKQD